jgi:hypothetical protein
MAQAESLTTAIRELMSRDQPPKSTSSVRAAHAEFVAALAGNFPRSIYPEANSRDLEGQNIPGSTLDRRYLDHRFQEFSADALGVIRNAAAEMRGHDRRVS